MLIFLGLGVVHLNWVPVLALLPHAPGSLTTGKLGRVVSVGEHPAVDEHNPGNSALALDFAQGMATKGMYMNPSSSHDPHHLPQSSLRPEQAGVFDLDPQMTAEWAQYWPPDGYNLFEDFSSGGLLEWNQILNEETDTSGAEVGSQLSSDDQPTAGYSHLANALPNQVSLKRVLTSEFTTAPTSMKPWPEYYAPCLLDQQSFHSAAKEHVTQPIKSDLSSIGSSSPKSTPAISTRPRDSRGRSVSKKPLKKHRHQLAFEQEKWILREYQAVRSKPGFTRKVLQFDRDWLDRLGQKVNQINEENRVPWANFLRAFQELLEKGERQARAYLDEGRAAHFFRNGLGKFWSHGTKGKSVDEEKSDGENSSQTRNFENDYRDICHALEKPENIFKFRVDVGAQSYERALHETFNLPSGASKTNRAQIAFERKIFAQSVEMRRLFLAHVFLINEIIIDKKKPRSIDEGQERAAAFFKSLGGLDIDREQAVAKLRASGKLPHTQGMLAEYSHEMVNTLAGYRKKYKNLWNLIRVWLEAERPRVSTITRFSPQAFRQFITYILMAELEVW